MSSDDDAQDSTASRPWTGSLQARHIDLSSGGPQSTPARGPAESLAEWVDRHVPSSQAESLGEHVDRVGRQPTTLDPGPTA